MLISFPDTEGINCQEFLPPNETVKQAFCLQSLVCLWQFIYQIFGQGTNASVETFIILNLATCDFHIPTAKTVLERASL